MSAMIVTNGQPNQKAAERKRKMSLPYTPEM
jgi:hypothetical protein